MLMSIIIKLGMKNPIAFLNVLYKSEYAVAAFCFKNAIKAKEERYYGLSNALFSHAQSEKRHGQMLEKRYQRLIKNASTNNPKRVSSTGNGQWLEIIRNSTGEKIIHNEYINNPTVKTVIWDSFRFPGEQLTGTFENFDGISRRYLALRFLYGNRTASSFSWADKIAFMFVLESFNHEFYTKLSLSSNVCPKLAKLAQKIASEELQHADYLSFAINHFTDDKQAIIDKWRKRVFWAKIILIFDICTLIRSIKYAAI